MRPIAAAEEEEEAATRLSQPPHSLTHLGLNLQGISQITQCRFLESLGLAPKTAVDHIPQSCNVLPFRQSQLDTLEPFIL